MCSNWNSDLYRDNFKRAESGFVPKPRCSATRTNGESRLVNLKGIFQEQAFSQDFRRSASGRMRPTARKVFLVSGTRRAEVSKMKNNGEKKLAQQSGDFRKVQFGENFKYYSEPPWGPLAATSKDLVTP